MTTLRKNAGFGLLEVLIAMLVIAVGLLGISAVQLRASQAEMESYQRAQALLLVDDMANRLRANAAVQDCYVLGNFGIANVGDGATDFAGTGCNAVADADLVAWHNLLLGAAETLADDTAVGAIIGARGCIDYDNTLFTYRVTVAWQGISETFAPTGNTCGENAYGSELKRRVASSTFRIGTL